MPKKSWASEEQQTWLLAQLELADFRQAQEAKTTSGFFIELYQKFHEKWPLASPNADEISKAEGSEEKAITLKQKASELVSVPYTHNRLCLMVYTTSSVSTSTSITKAGDQPQGLEHERL